MQFFFAIKLAQFKKRVLTLHRNSGETPSPDKANAKIAQLVEHDLAKVGGRGSVPFFAPTIRKRVSMIGI